MNSGQAAQHGTWTVAVVIGSIVHEPVDGPSQTKRRRPFRDLVLDLSKRAADSRVDRQRKQVTSTTWFGSALEAIEVVKDNLVQLESGRSTDNIAFSAALVTGDCSLGDPSSRPVQKARLLAQAAAEGQTIVSVATYEVARDAVPEPVGFRDLGTVSLSQEISLEKVYQLTSPGLRESFPSHLLVGTVINNSPREFGYLVGRHEERELIEALLERGPVAIIVGPAGIGKSHLACRIAGEVLETWAEGIVWVDLVRATDQSSFRIALAKAFGMPDAELSTVEARVARSLRGRSLMVVFDGADRCHGPLSNLIGDLVRSSGPRMVVTSSKRLGMAGEQVVSLRGLSVPPRDERLTAEELEDYEATALFLDRARRARPNFDAGPVAEDVAKICQRLEGNPLALVLAARQVHSLKPSRILERLSSLVGGSGRVSQATAAKRHVNLVSAIEWSCRSLEQSALELLKVASVIHGSWRIEDVAALAERDDNQVAKDVRELLDAGLVTEADGLSKELAYRVQGSVATSLKRTQEKASVDRLAERHSEYFIGLLCRTVQEQGSVGDPDAMRILDWYRRDISAALNHTIQPGKHPTTLIEALSLSWSFWYQRNLIEEGLGLYRRAIKACPHPDHYDVARMLNGAGILSMKASDVRVARRFYNRALRVAERNQSHPNYARLRAIVLGNLASLEYIEGRPEESIPLYAQACAILREEKDDPRRGTFLVSAVGSYVEVGNLRAAESTLLECQPILCRSIDARDQRALLMGAAMVAWLKAEYSDSRTRLNECAGLGRRAGDMSSLAISHLWLAQVELDAGSYEAAAESLGTMGAAGRGSGTHLYPIQELRAARIEGALIAKLGSGRVRELRLWGEISANLGN